MPLIGLKCPQCQFSVLSDWLKKRLKSLLLLCSPISDLEIIYRQYYFLILIKCLCIVMRFSLMYNSILNIVHIFNDFFIVVACSCYIYIMVVVVELM